MCAAVSVYVRFAGSCVPACGRRSSDRAVWRAALASLPARGGSAVVVTDGGEPETGYLYTVVSVDVVWAKSDVDGLLDPSGVPMRFVVDAPHIVPIGPVTSSPGMFRYRRSVHTGESHVALVLFDSLSDGPAGFADVYPVALVTRDLVHNTSASTRGDRVLGVDELVSQGGGGTEHRTDTMSLEDSPQLPGDAVHKGEYSKRFVLNPLHVVVQLGSR